MSFPHEAITPRTVDSSVRTSLLVSEPPRVWGPYKHKSYTLNFLTERQSHCVVPLALPLYQLRHTDALRGEQHGVWRLCSGLAGWSLLACTFWRLPYQSLEEDSNLSHHLLRRCWVFLAVSWPLFWAPRSLRLPDSWQCSRREVTSLTDNSRLQVLHELQDIIVPSVDSIASRCK